MQGSGSESAMTEVALALAMAFFALMVLALTVMSTDFLEQAVSNQSVNKPEQETARAVENRNSGESASTESNNLTLIVYFQGQYFDQTLTPVSPGFGSTDKVLLALPPDISLSESIAAKASLTSQDITLTVLDERWLNRIYEMGL